MGDHARDRRMGEIDKQLGKCPSHTPLPKLRPGQGRGYLEIVHGECHQKATARAMDTMPWGGSILPGRPVRAKNWWVFKIRLAGAGK